MSDPRLAEAQALASQGRFAEAAELCHAAAARRPGDAQAWLLLGAALLRLGDADGSMAASRRALELDQQVALALQRASLTLSLSASSCLSRPSSAPEAGPARNNVAVSDRVRRLVMS